jgi:hypothetical protein
MKNEMINRREMIRGMAGAVVAAPLLPSIATAATSKSGPRRVIFFMQNQGFDPATSIPKDQINLPTRGGGIIFYDHVRVWKALPLAK